MSFNGTFDPSVTHSFSATPKGDGYKRVYTAFVKTDAQGKKTLVNPMSLTGAKDGNNALGYYDVARLANGYSLVFSNNETPVAGNLVETELATYETAIDVKDWSDDSAIDLKSLLIGRTLQANDQIRVYINDAKQNGNGEDAIYQGQLMIYNPDENKYGLSSVSDWQGDNEASFGGKDFQKVKPQHQEDFDIVLTQAAANAINTIISEEHKNDASYKLLFKSPGCHVTKIAHAHAPEVIGGSDSEAIVENVSIAATDNKIKMVADMIDGLQNGGNVSTGSYGQNEDGTYYYKSFATYDPAGDGFMTDAESYDWHATGVDREVKFHNFTAGDKITVNVTGAWTGGDYVGQAHFFVKSDKNSTGIKHMFGSNNYTDVGSTCEEGTGNGFFTVELTADEADCLNGTNAIINLNGRNVKFTSMDYVGKNEWTPAETQEPVDTENLTYELKNLWNAKNDTHAVPAEGWDGQAWGFKTGSTGYQKYLDYGEPKNTDSYSFWADIKAVNDYFTGEDPNVPEDKLASKYKHEWMSQSYAPDLWAVYVPSFVATPGDKLVIALDCYGTSNTSNENNNDKSQLQMWYSEIIDGKPTMTFYNDLANAVVLFGHDINIQASTNYYNGQELTFTIPLTGNLIDAFEKGLRLKGNNFRIHRVDLIALTEKNKEVKEENIYQIHVEPEALKAHAHWDLASFESDICLPSHSKDLKHHVKNGNDWNAAGNDTPHMFAEQLYLNFNVAENATIDYIEVYTFTPAGLRADMADMLTEHETMHFTNDMIVAGHYIPAAVKNTATGETKPLFGGDYAPNANVSKYGTDEANGIDGGRYIELKTAVTNETHDCQCTKHKDEPAAIWYMPKKQLFENIKANGLYFEVKVTTTTEANGTNKPRRLVAPKAETGANDPSGYTFKSLEGDYADSHVKYALATGFNGTPAVLFNQVGIANVTNVPTGVDNIAIDENAEVEYFNVQGMRVDANNLTPGVYVVRQGSKAHKVIIK